MAVLGQDLAPIRDSISGALAALRGATDAADQASPSFASVLRSVSQPPQSGLDAGLAPLYQVGYGAQAGGGFGGNAWQTLANAASAFGAGGGLNLDLSQAWQSIGSFGNYQAARAAAAVPDTRGTPQPGPAPAPAPGTGGTGAGASPGVAKWAGQTKQVFGDLLDPDVMLAIMENESGGDPAAYNPNAPGGAWGLFQNVGLGSNDPNAQFAAARTLAEQKVASIAQSYKANGLNPDERTRAMDFALAWAGHFDYSTGRLNPNSRDAGSNQSASQLADIFLHHYDAIKAAGRSAATPQGGTYTGVGGLPSITGGSGSISQDFQVVDPTVPQSIYDYGQGSGVHGHTGLDWSVPAGTQVYMPAGLSGTVTTAGGTAYFRDEDENGAAVSPQGQGELKIHLSNGMDLILGHMRNISVPVGTQLTAGQLVGLSGSATGGHVHVELRVPDSSMPNGYRIIDPRTVLGGGG